ncbi:uncharacterized protein LOC143857108 [Tasmannia lanceolata]|uniref:uncharacterized protein LOC143857108 n=1 Tax=Tasmannia lanceolata TaxID=3420 RepID=UPI0040643462
MLATTIGNVPTYSKTEVFKKVICQRFGPRVSEDPIADIIRLRQSGMVVAYRERFEKIFSKTEDLSDQFFISAFLAGLKDEIRPGVQKLKPTTLDQAIELTGLEEESIDAINRRPRPSPKLALLPSPPGSKPQFDGNNGLPPIKHLTEKQMMERREKGLCYNCDEKFVPGHRCDPNCFY